MGIELVRFGDDTNAHARDEHRARAGDPNINVRPERLAALTDDPNNHLLVLEVQGVVVGTAFLTLCLDYNSVASTCSPVLSQR